MAVVTLKSTLVTNMDATPPVRNNALFGDSALHEAVATIVLTSGNSIASIYRMFRVWSGWRISELLLFCDAITTCDTDIGLYDTAANGGAVVDADFFASAQALTAAIVVGTNVLHESAVVPIENSAKRIWEQLALTADPGKWYDVALTLTAAAGSTGDVSMICRWVDLS